MLNTLAFVNNANQQQDFHLSRGLLRLSLQRNLYFCWWWIGDENILSNQNDHFDEPWKIVDILLFILLTFQNKRVNYATGKRRGQVTTVQYLRTGVFPPNNTHHHTLITFFKHFVNSIMNRNDSLIHRDFRLDWPVKAQLCVNMVNMIREPFLNRYHPNYSWYSDTTTIIPFTLLFEISFKSCLAMVTLFFK